MRGLIAVEPTKVTTKAGVTRNGTLQFTLLPPQNVIARHYEEKLAELELTTERQRVQELLEQHPKNAPHTPYLDTKHAEEYLPRILSDVLEGKLGAFGKRMGHLIFKQAVDQDVMANLLASDINVDLDTLQKLRVRCVKNVKETNGEIDFQDAFRFQKRIEE